MRDQLRSIDGGAGCRLGVANQKRCRVECGDLCVDVYLDDWTF
jgi:hypothetical protein